MYPRCTVWDTIYVSSNIPPPCTFTFVQGYTINKNFQRIVGSIQNILETWCSRTSGSEFITNKTKLSCRQILNHECENTSL